MPLDNLEILRTVSSFKPGDVVTDTDVQLMGATTEDWLNAGIAKRTDKERSEDLDLFHVPGTRENAARLDAEAVRKYEADKALAEKGKAAAAKAYAAKQEAANAADGKPGSVAPPAKPAGASATPVK